MKEKDIESPLNFFFRVYFFYFIASNFLNKVKTLDVKISLYLNGFNCTFLFVFVTRTEYICMNKFEEKKAPKQLKAQEIFLGAIYLLQINPRVMLRSFLKH